jgi:hypothetical protein
MRKLQGQSQEHFAADVDDYQSKFYRSYNKIQPVLNFFYKPYTRETPQIQPNYMNFNEKQHVWRSLSNMICIKGQSPGLKNLVDRVSGRF